MSFHRGPGGLTRRWNRWGLPVGTFSPAEPLNSGPDREEEEPPRRVVWKFGGTSVADVDQVRAVARRLVAARREDVEVVAVLSAMGSTTDELAELAHRASRRPPPRELDALLSVGESITCALA